MLDQIIMDTRQRLSELMARQDDVMSAANAAEPPREFASALSTTGLSVIAEFKRRSPSRGLLSDSIGPAAQAEAYAAGGAAALSVLTEPRHFSGSLDDLAAARAAVRLPVLRKDFTIHPLQIWEARAAGADAVLLIVAVLDDADLAALLAAADEAGLAALVEVHDAEEARRAIGGGAEIVGVNNRDLSTFDVDLRTAEALAPLLEPASIRVAESGILGGDDARRMRDAGYDAVLVGEHLVRASDPTAAIQELTSA